VTGRQVFQQRFASTKRPWRQSREVGPSLDHLSARHYWPSARRRGRCSMSMPTSWTSAPLTCAELSGLRRPVWRSWWNSSHQALSQRVEPVKQQPVHRMCAMEPPFPSVIVPRPGPGCLLSVCGRLPLGKGKIHGRSAHSRMLPSVRPGCRNCLPPRLYGSSRAGSKSLKACSRHCGETSFPDSVSPTVAPYSIVVACAVDASFR
jgi:hypothetical protein